MLGRNRDKTRERNLAGSSYEESEEGRKVGGKEGQERRTVIRKRRET